MTRATSNPTTREVWSNGWAVVWDDLRFPAQTVKLDSTNPPTATAYKWGSVLSFASTPSQKIYFNAQLPHGYKLGTDLDFHIHIVLPVSWSGSWAENVKFDFTYSWAAIGADFPAETTITATRDVQNDTADNHIIFDIWDVLNSNMVWSWGVSEMLICSLKRDTWVANDYANAVYLLEADFHYQADQIGSLLEYSKS